MSSTAVGLAHTRRGQPGEDAHGVTTEGPWTVAAVADGHGSARYPRADRGARLAVDCALSRLSALPVDEPSTVHAELLSVPSRLTTDWRQAVLADLTADPLSADESNRAGIDPDSGVIPADAGVIPADRQVNAYGSTLVAAAASERWLVVVQIGDGDAVAGRDGLGRAIRPVPPPAGSDPRYTDSLCQVDADRRSRVTLKDLPADPVDLVLLATDGFGAAFENPDWHDATIAQLLATRRDLDDTALAAAISTWCAAPAEVGGDDVSLALLVARDDFDDMEDDQ